MIRYLLLQLSFIASSEQDLLFGVVQARFTVYGSFQIIFIFISIVMSMRNDFLLISISFIFILTVVYYC